MFRINLRPGIKAKASRRVSISVPRLVVAAMTGFIAFALWACGSSSFRGTAPANPNPPNVKDSEQNPSPPENGDGQQEGPKQDASIDPRRSLELQISGLQPEAWWNNCLKVELGGKSFSIACTKDNNVTGKVVRIPIPEGVSCPTLNLKVETFMNVGTACADKARLGQTCNGPFESLATFVRSHDKPADRAHFVLSEAAQAGGGKLIRVYFEDQPTQKIDQVKMDPGKAKELGIDYNDAIFDIKTLELPFEIQGAAGTKCP